MGKREKSMHLIFKGDNIERHFTDRVLYETSSVHFRFISKGFYKITH